jgi:hypothetical protein
MASHFLLLAALVRTAARASGVDPHDRPYRLLLCATLLVTVVSELHHGQTNLLVCSLVAAGLLWIETGRPGPGGLALALAAHLKVAPAVLVLPLLAQRRWAAARWALGGAALLTLLPAVWTAPRSGLGAGLARCASLHAEFARAIVGPALSRGTVAGQQQFFILNNSLSAVAHRLFAAVRFSERSTGAEGPLLFALPPALLTAAPAVASLALLSAAVWLALRSAGRRSARVASLGLALVAVQLGAPTFWEPTFWEHHLVSLVFLLAPLAAARPRWIAWACAAPLALALTVPYLLQLPAQAGGPDLGGDWIAGSRIRGAPTAGAVALWAGCFAYHARGNRAEP